MVLHRDNQPERRTVCGVQIPRTPSGRLELMRTLEGPDEESHIIADALLCEELRERGCGALVDAYHLIDKWFA